MPTASEHEEESKRILAVGLAHASRMGLRRDEAQDCAIEFLECIYKAKTSVSSPAWLHRCAHNFASNYVRALSRRRRREQTWSERYADTAEQQMNGQPSIAPGPKTLLLRRELWQQVAIALKQLTPTQQELFVRYHLRNNTVRELAARYGRTPHAIEESLSNIRRRLGVMLRQQGWTEQDAAALFRPTSKPRIHCPTL